MLVRVGGSVVNGQTQSHALDTSRSLHMPKNDRRTSVTRAPRAIARLLAPTVFGGVMAAALAFALGGPIEPPAGAVGDSSTSASGLTPPYKTLGQIEPRVAVQTLAGSATAQFVIDRPGSYYLTGNITGTPGKHAIVIASDNVTLDLSGFALIGAAQAGDGINSSSTSYYKNISVSNGTIRGWPGNGVNISADNSRLERLRISNNTLSGISTGTALGTVIQNCHLTDNAAGHIFTGANCVVEDCTLTTTSLLGSPIGINTADGSVVRRCTMQGIRGVAIQAGGSMTVENNTITGGKSDAINVGQRSLVRGNNISGNTGSGIILNGQACVVLENTLISNAPGSTIAGGIITTQNNHRIEGNALLSNGLGLKVTGNGSIVIRNTGRGNTTNFTISATNAVGPLVNVALGGDMSDVVNSNHPMANFSH
jgi:hypothetical protein